MIIYLKINLTLLLFDDSALKQLIIN